MMRVLLSLAAVSRFKRPVLRLFLVLSCGVTLRRRPAWAARPSPCDSLAIDHLFGSKTLEKGQPSHGQESPKVVVSGQQVVGRLEQEVFGRYLRDEDACEREAVRHEGTDRAGSAGRSSGKRKESHCEYEDQRDKSGSDHRDGKEG